MVSVSELSGLVGLIFFFVFFVVVVSWMFRPGAKEKYKEYGNIPFEGNRNKGGGNE